MNHIIIAGRLGADPETRFTPSGQKVTTFRMATNARRKGKEETVWWNITVWGDRFDKMMPYLKKGSAVIVSGELNPPTTYTDRNGSTQISLDVTAESIKFSPFGRGQEDQDGGSAQSFSQQKQLPDEGFGEQTFNPFATNESTPLPVSGGPDDDSMPF